MKPYAHPNQYLAKNLTFCVACSAKTLTLDLVNSSVGYEGTEYTCSIVNITRAPIWLQPISTLKPKCTSKPYEKNSILGNLVKINSNAYYLVTYSVGKRQMLLSVHNTRQILQRPSDLKKEFYSFANFKYQLEIY